eukprot:gene5781-2063_t
MSERGRSRSAGADYAVFTNPDEKREANVVVAGDGTPASRLYWIDWLRLSMVYKVVLGHLWWFITKPKVERGPLADKFGTYLVYVGITHAIPTLFFVSGAATAVSLPAYSGDEIAVARRFFVKRLRLVRMLGAVAGVIMAKNVFLTCVPYADAGGRPPTMVFVASWGLIVLAWVTGWWISLWVLEAMFPIVIRLFPGGDQGVFVKPWIEFFDTGNTMSRWEWSTQEMLA